MLAAIWTRILWRISWTPAFIWKEFLINSDDKYFIFSFFSLSMPHHKCMIMFRSERFVTNNISYQKCFFRYSVFHLQYFNKYFVWNNWHTCIVNSQSRTLQPLQNKQWSRPVRAKLSSLKQWLNDRNQNHRFTTEFVQIIHVLSPKVFSSGILHLPIWSSLVKFSMG